MTDLVHQFVRVPKHLIRDRSDELQPRGQTLHLFLPLNAQSCTLDQLVVILVRSTSGRNHPNTLLHLFLGDVVGRSGLLNQVFEEEDEVPNLFRFEPNEIEGPTGEVGRKRSSSE